MKQRERERNRERGRERAQKEYNKYFEFGMSLLAIISLKAHGKAQGLKLLLTFLLILDLIISVFSKTKFFYHG